MKLILASMSRYRQEQLQSLGYTFEVVPAHIDETRQPGESARELTLRLARKKAETVATSNPLCTVIGSDQVGECQGEILTKPGDRASALKRLMQYPNSTIRFQTAVAVRSPQDKILEDVVSTTIKFREFTLSEAEAYLDLDKPYDCAGAIKSEQHGLLLFEWVKSDDPSALIGLPLIRTSSFLREVGINPLIEVASSTH